MGDRQSMKIESIRFSDLKIDLDLRQLQALFNQSAFWAIDRQLEDLQIAIDRSEPVISAWDSDRLVGFARATSDGVYRATIWDVVINSDYQGLGLGRKLVETLLAHPVMIRVERIYLSTTHQQGFYERMGFERNSSTTMVMVRESRVVNICKHSEDKAERKLDR
jgi:N-acetylglutamate synthase-like GNAT family acetyltransferase